MKKRLALSFLAMMCSHAWSAEQPQSPPPDTSWQSAAGPDSGQAQPAPQNANDLQQQAGLLAQPASQPAAPPQQAQAAPQAQPAAPQQQQATPQAAQTQGDDLPLPSPLYKAAQAQVSPLSPDEVRELRGQKEQINRAMSAPTMTVVPRISAQTVDLSPGASIPLVRTATHNASNLSFTDATGAPWEVIKPYNANTQDFDVYFIKGSPLVTIIPKRAYATGNVTVFLKGLNVPIMINVTSGETDSKSRVWTIDSRLDLRLPRRGPSAAPMAAPESKIGVYDDTLQAVLDGTPPREAHRLKTTGGVPETTVWQLGDDLYIRSRAQIMDEFDQTLSSADGMHLWKLPVTPYVTFAVMGRNQALNITLE